MAFLLYVLKEIMQPILVRQQQCTDFAGIFLPCA